MMDNGDNTYTAVICVSTMDGLNNTPVCRQNGIDVTCDPYIWEKGGSCTINGSCFLPPDATPNPTNTPSATPNFYNVNLILSASPSDDNGYFTVYQSSDNITFEESVTLTSSGNDYVTQSFNGTPGYYYYLKITKPGGTVPDLNLYTQVSSTDFSPGPINGAWCLNNSRLLESDVFQLPNPIQNRASITFFGGIGEGCI
jgi:hypothetical protein